MRFYRAQRAGIKLEQMLFYNSIDGGDDENIGLAVSASPDGYDGGSRFGGAWDALDGDDEIIILEGDIVVEIYDGYRIRPTKEIARFSLLEWEEKLEDGTAYEYE